MSALTKEEIAYAERTDAMLAKIKVPKYPMRRKYVMDEKTGELIDVRLTDQESKQDGIIFRARTYNNLGPYPIYVESKGQLKSILKSRNLVEAG